MKKYFETYPITTITTTSGTSDGSYYWQPVPQVTFPHTHSMNIPSTIEVKITNPEQEQPPMRGLYKVYIINLTTDQVTEVGPLVAADEDAAKMKAAFSPDIKRVFMESDVEDVMSDEFLENFDFVVEEIGSVKPRIKKDAG